MYDRPKVGLISAAGHAKNMLGECLGVFAKSNTTPSIKSTLSEIGEAVVSYVEAAMSNLAPNVENLAVEQLTVEYLGPRGPEPSPIAAIFPDDDEEEMHWGHHR